MKSFYFNLYPIFCLLNFISANITDSNLNKSHISIKNKSTTLPNPTFYIAGGDRDPTSLELINYMVSIRSRNPQKYFGDNHFCAGTFITKSAVLTAAHCVME